MTFPHNISANWDIYSPSCFMSLQCKTASRMKNSNAKLHCPSAEMAVMTFDLSRLVQADCDEHDGVIGRGGASEVTALSSRGEQLVSRSRSRSAGVWMCLRRTHGKTTTMGKKKSSFSHLQLHKAPCLPARPPGETWNIHLMHIWWESFKRLGCRSSFITAGKQSSFDPLRSQIKPRLYSAFVSCWFYTKHNVASSGYIFLNPDSLSGVSSPWIPWWSWTTLAGFSATGDKIP